MRCWPWAHRWRPIAVDPLYIQTFVRDACGRCGKQRTRTVKGVWTLETLGHEAAEREQAAKREAS